MSNNEKYCSVCVHSFFVRDNKHLFGSHQACLFCNKRRERIPKSAEAEDYKCRFWKI